MCVITVVQHCWNALLFYFIDPSFSCVHLKRTFYIDYKETQVTKTFFYQIVMAIVFFCNFKICKFGQITLSDIFKNEYDNALQLRQAWELKFSFWNAVKNKRQEVTDHQNWFLPAKEMLFFLSALLQQGVLLLCCTPNTLSLGLIWTKLHVLCRQEVQNVWFHNVFTVQFT